MKRILFSLSPSQFHRPLLSTRYATQIAFEAYNLAPGLLIQPREITVVGRRGTIDQSEAG